MSKILLKVLNIALVCATLSSVNNGFPNYFEDFVETFGQSPSIKFDEVIAFDIYFNDESESTKKDHLDNFAREVKERPKETGYIISYAGKRAKVNESLNNLNKIKHYLTKKKKIPLQRLVFIDGGYRDRGMTYFYFVPEGAIPPIPAPSLLPSEVIIIK